MKKTLAILLALCLLLGGAALAENGAALPMGEPVWCYDSITYSAYVEGALEGDVVIPGQIEGNTVYTLYMYAMVDQNAVTSLTLPDTMYALQDNSLTHMAALERITLNDTLEVIGDTNFTDLPALTSVTIPASVRLIDDSFKSCPSLREIRFEGECPIFLGLGWIFWDLPEDYVIYVPDDQVAAYREALEDANGAAEHIQPSGKNAVARKPMDNEDWFTFDADTGSITGYIDYHAFVEIPAAIDGTAVKSIAASAVYSDSSIYGLVLPEGLERVEKGAFENCYELVYLRLPSTLKTVEDDGFNNTRFERIDWSEGLETIGARAFCPYVGRTLILPSTVKTIGESAFERSTCQELYLGNALESIGSRAFANTFLNYMSFDLYAPIDIAADAFADNHIADLDLPWDCSFENRAAYAELLREQCPDCTVWINNPAAAGVAETPINDQSICRFENGVWTMYKGDQPSLTTWTKYNDIPVTTLGDGVFKGNQTIRAFYPDHCGYFTTIGNEAFADSSVEYVEMFGTITTIGSGAFRNCLNLKSLILPASLTSIGADALAGCENLEELIVLCDPAILPEGLLDECAARTAIYAAPDATEEQLLLLSEKAGRPWYAPISRLGEAPHDLVQMPYAMFLIDDFWYDTEYARLDRYHGYELNLYLPREAEGVTLNTLGGDMMGRARGGDNYEMELPVRSVVIPENYTNIYSTTFANCETLETVICYAPLEVTAGMFEGCTNLRQVVFVNGVRSLGRGIFYGCEQLETVYVGPYVKEISDEAFIGCPNFDLSKCITDSAQMPDVETLLTAVRSDPMPEPTPAPTAAPAVPVGDAGAPYVGTWSAVTLEMDGESYPMSMMGAEMYFTLNADGTAESYDGEITESGVWTIENDTIVIGGIEGVMPITVSETGELIMEADGMKLIFVKDGSETPTAPALPEAPAAPVSMDAASLVGIWQADTLEMDGESYPVGLMGLDMRLTLNADGTAEFFDGEETETGDWTFGDGLVIVTEMLLTFAENGTLVMEDEGMKLIFVKADGETPAAPAQPEAPAVPVATDVASLVGVWQADTLEMDGESYPVGLMGLDMRLTLNADGTAESYDGESTESGAWAYENGQVIVDGVAIEVTGDGRLLMADEDSKLYFVKADAALTEAPAAPTEEPAAPTEEPAAPISLDDRMDRKYICVSALVGEEPMLGSQLGGEYSLCFHADGTVDFVIGGIMTMKLNWTETDDGLIIDYSGNPMKTTLTEEGFELDFLGAMLLQLAPEE